MSFFSNFKGTEKSISIFIWESLRTRSMIRLDSPKVSSIVVHSLSMSASGPLNQSREHNASLLLFFPRYQRGVSGMGNIRMTNKAEGIAPINANHLHLHRTPIT